ncbi:MULTISPECIES: class I SAM-dependent methyltransferase [unclassified Spirosoma]|uniref:class I SAM-dependent methyltransferase n=1 Tax=unclassified Spirosoma TaxID=2621999 RepID=UPI000968CECB|nr:MULTISPECIES: class I SAM-dependent methyltransferase [unclassified Spirosoma]MBN8826855.1 class I SAM-dependent methyltransferase [Spirosoma sp.]OJW75536.1 MAG: methyltransferase type 11 [Spirosoma sp. 48-14]
MAFQKPTDTQSIYEPEFVEQLFNEMSLTYERMNTITSFGFSNRWRRQCVAELAIQPGQVVIDLMTGMGETWDYICQRIGPGGTLIGVDFSEGMLQYADQKRQRKRFTQHTIHLYKQNVLAGTLPDQSADHVIVSFGLKTFNSDQISQLAQEINRILKPGGQFSCIEVSVPRSTLLRALYLFYLRRVIPVLGATFLGNPETYRMLGIYCTQFKDTQQAQQLFQKAGLTCHTTRYFFGCASGIVGNKPV